VSLGKLPKGKYTGWGRLQTLASYPTWVDADGKVVTTPIWAPKEDTKVKHTFTVK
jgi:hypothetical protein